VPGKRTFHEFSPISECKVAVKRCSEDKEFMILSIKVKYHITILFFSMVACVYKIKWWIGIG